MTTITQPDAADYTGLDDNGNEYLLTVWADGTRTLAMRPLGDATWGVPVLVERSAALVAAGVVPSEGGGAA